MRSYVVVDSFVLLLPVFVFMCLVIVLQYSNVCPFKFCKHLVEERKVGRLTSIGLVLLCCCYFLYFFLKIPWVVLLSVTVAFLDLS